MLTKTVYSYDVTTKEYIGETVAYESPRRPGSYLIPANATEAAPPDTVEHQAAVFDVATQEWVIKADYREIVYYDTRTQEKQTVADIGVEPDSNWTHVAPTDTDAIWTGRAWEVPFDILRDRKAAEIRSISAAKVAAIQEGYTLGEVNTFEQQYSGAVEILANGVAEDITTMSKDAQFVIGLARGRSAVGGVEVTPEALSQKIVANYDAAKEYTVTILSLQQGLETKARMATSREELQAIKWPETV